MHRDMIIRVPDVVVGLSAIIASLVKLGPIPKIQPSLDLGELVYVPPVHKIPARTSPFT